MGSMLPFSTRLILFESDNRSLPIAPHLLRILP